MVFDFRPVIQSFAKFHDDNRTLPQPLRHQAPGSDSCEIYVTLYTILGGRGLPSERGGDARRLD